ncbi:MAG: 5-formyltetrahydrofolate cyclo-ligase [Alphaproteobacteria bacterium]|nr:5-formyltetrahydrofolate cyclo-ligase [Alphaproteobacteria bacterium]
MPNLKELKKQFRNDVQAKLREQTAPSNSDVAQKVRDNFLGHFKNLDPKLVVAGTAPINHEMSPMPLMEALQKMGHPLCLPVTGTRATPLLFRAYKIGDKLVPDVWNIGIPDEHQTVCEPDIILCPMLAFDRTGARLGYGGGYYDATLQSLRAKKTIMVVGVAHARQEVPMVPTGKYDQKLDVIITEKEVIVPAIVTHRQR